MKYNKKVNPKDEPLIQRAIPLVDVAASSKHFLKHIRTHRQGTRDLLPGVVMAGLALDASAGTRNTLEIELREFIESHPKYSLTREEIEKNEFADLYDIVRELNLQDNDGKSCDNDFWGAAWGVYTSALLNYAKDKDIGRKNTTYGDLFD